MLCIVLFSGCNHEEPDNQQKAAAASPWWGPLEADVVIGTDEFYAGRCSITRVKHQNGVQSASVIFEVPYRLMAVCENSQIDNKPLKYDGEYISLSVCQTVFGAGGCPKDMYRSADFENWEEYIGVTWIEGEEYEAWRKLGSTSTKADSVKKVVRY